MSWETIVLKRDDLYREVWAEPVQSVAKRYGLSGTGLAKICHKLDVSLPPRGYWAKKGAGHRVTQPPLAQPEQNSPTEHRLTVHRSEYGPELFDPRAVAAMEKEWQAGSRIAVAEELIAPHPLVKLSAPFLRKSHMKVRAEVLPATRCLDVVVSRDQVGRALRIMDALVKALAARGLEVEATAPIPPQGGAGRWGREAPSPRPSQTRVRVAEEFVELGMEEQLDTVWPAEPKPGRDASLEERWAWERRHGRPGYKRVPSGRLALKILNSSWLEAPRTSWRDGKHQRIEELLNEVVVGILDAGERRRIWSERRARQERARVEAERRAEEVERRRRLEAARVKDLEERLDAWAKAVAIEELARELERVHAASAPARWLTWARLRAESLRCRATGLPKEVDQKDLEPCDL